MRNKKDGRTKYKRFRCRSWRHTGSQCQVERGKEDFKKILHGIKSMQYWTYVVITLPGGEGRPKTEAELWGAYRALYDKWDKFRKRLTRRIGVFKYICVVEQHLDGVPHLNILISSETLWLECKAELTFAEAESLLVAHGYGDAEIGRILSAWRKECENSVAGWRVVRQTWLKEHLGAVGFGEGARYIEPVRSEDAIAYYLLKLLREVSKLNQVPICAPPRFRRLRASRGVLPVWEKKESDWEGELFSVWIDACYADIQKYQAEKLEIIDVEEIDRDGEKEVLESFVVAPLDFTGHKPIQDAITALIQFDVELEKAKAKSVPNAPRACKCGK